MVSAVLRVVVTVTLIVQLVSYYSTLGHECASEPADRWLYTYYFRPSSGMVGMMMICKNARQAPRAASQEARMRDVIARPTVASVKRH